ncbi:METK-like protein [Mya arenaria]|uniref:METK-like protein n=1 Tax=Mya arenaria TaxID=6604 RepID=A0ABY7DHK3_MYAAR|nr:METK-like protein [Mya arenaria]
MQLQPCQFVCLSPARYWAILSRFSDAGLTGRKIIVDTYGGWGHMVVEHSLLSYAIGIAQPLSITVLSYGTSTKSERDLLQIVRNNFDLRPGRIVKELNLKNPIYQKTACYGHFGRPEFTWEQAKPLKL